MIGIIGGIGPAAGVDLVEKIIAVEEGRLDEGRTPVILYSDPSSVPSRNAFLLGDSDINPAGSLLKIVEKLAALNADLVAIACNAAHSQPIFSVLQESVISSGLPVRLLNLIDLLAERVSREGLYTKLGVLSVAGTYHAGAYREPFSRKGLQILDLTDELVGQMHSVIWNREYGVKAHSNPTHPEARRKAEEVMNFYIANGADAIILGCTEYPLLLKETSYRGIPILDANRLFAELIIEAYEKK